jgi:hypothetical protein
MNIRGCVMESASVYSWAARASATKKIFWLAQILINAIVKITGGCAMAPVFPIQYIAMVNVLDRILRNAPDQKSAQNELDFAMTFQTFCSAQITSTFLEMFVKP